MEIHVNIEEQDKPDMEEDTGVGWRRRAPRVAALIRLFCILLKLLGKIHLPHDGNDAECKLGHL